MTKVLMISLDSSILKPGSVASYRMADYGSICDELHILVLKDAGDRIKISENVFAYPCGSSRIAAIFSAIKTGKKILAGGNKWIITAQDPFETGFIAWRLAKKFNAGLEIQMHGDFYGNSYWEKERLLNYFRFYLGKWVLQRANAVRVVSERIKKSISGFVKEKIYEIPVLSNLPQTGDADFLRKKFLNAFPIILAVGNLVPVKNHKLLIETFADIKKELPEAKLVIVGEGPERKALELLTTHYSLQTDVEFSGHQNNLADDYSSADIFVHPSLYEGWGRAVVEAAQFSLPIVMTDVGLAGEIIKNNESGLIVPVNDKEALKKAIIRLAQDEALRKRLGEGVKFAVSRLPNKEQYLNKIKESWEAIKI
jgi:glycosyltransferase involved in cell wall biosynthesis